jgi:membrane-bound hydrogenase subunit beta
MVDKKEKKTDKREVKKDTKKLTPEEVVKYFKDEFKTKILNTEIKRRKTGVKKKEFVNIWMKIDKSIFKPLIKHLVDLTYPHLAVTSGSDLGKTIELTYHFSIYYGLKLEEISLNIAVEIPKTKPEIETICDLIPGALITEREKQEMLGIKVIGIPDSRRLFLPDDFPKDVYPWRKDEEGLGPYIKNLHQEVDKNEHN